MRRGEPSRIFDLQRGAFDAAAGVALLIGLVGAAVLIALGVWQVQRLAWKEGVLADDRGAHRRRPGRAARDARSARPTSTCPSRRRAR